MLAYIWVKTNTSKNAAKLNLVAQFHCTNDWGFFLNEYSIVHFRAQLIV